MNESITANPGQLPGGPPMVQMEGVYKSFGDEEVLRGIDLEVHQSEVLCLLGPSGSGKSTLLRCINRLEGLDAGRIRVDGDLVGYRESKGRLYDLTSAQLARQRRATGMVFQRFNLFAHMTAVQNVMEAPVQVASQPRREARRGALELLDRVGLADCADHYPAQLSGGQQQRVAIARALAMTPKLLLFDEPTSALDPELVGEVLDVIRELAYTGMTMVVVTHEIGFARDVGDSLVFMSDGYVVETGHPKDVLTSPKTDRMRRFLTVRHAQAGG